jgi:DNA-binding NtrC family response regulator
MNPTAPLAGGKPAQKTILIVDDQVEILEFMALILEDAGYRILQASDPFEAQHFGLNGTKIDLLVTDFQMPEMYGVELAEWFPTVCPDIKTLIVTGARTAYNAFCLDGRSFPCLEKPFTPAQLAAKVREVLNGSAIVPINPEQASQPRV